MRAVLLALLMLFPQILFAGTPIFSQEKIGNEPVVKILYNRGDDGNLSREQFFELVENLEKQLTNEIGVPAKQGRSSKKNALNDELFWQWQWKNGAVRLQAGFTKLNNDFRSEYIRVIFAKNEDALELGGARDTAKRRDIKENHLVIAAKGKRVYIKDIPMVDQGQKGYCLPAAVARIFALYGMESVDQHALAAVCDSSSDKGTSTLAMENALSEISKKFHVKLEILDGNDFDWLKDYNKIARKKRVPELSLPNLAIAEPNILREARANKRQVKKWMNEIRKTIKNGVPVLWSVTLGIYPESVPLPQTRGGHMRLIIGYDDVAGTILFSDTWGKGHELKSIKQADACAMTFRCYSLKPTR